MPSTSLEMHRNRFRPGLRPGPHWGSLQRSLKPLTGGEGARHVLPKNPTPSSALRASAIQATLCRLPTPPKINPSYGLAFGYEFINTDHAGCSFGDEFAQLVELAVTLKQRLNQTRLVLLVNQVDLIRLTLTSTLTHFSLTTQDNKRQNKSLLKYKYCHKTKYEPRDALCQSKSCQLLQTVGTSCTTNPQQIEVMELEYYGRPTCNKLRASNHNTSTVVGVVNKVERQRV